jgi:hypothetical protein
MPAGRELVHRKRTLQRMGVAAVVLCVICVTGAGTTVADDHGDKSVDLAGNGTAESPYEITTIEEFRAIENDLDAQYVLKHDIGAGDAAALEPIYAGGERFTGTFDGRGHTIQAAQGPLFHENGGTISNLRLETVEAEATQERMIPPRPIGTIARTNTGTITDVTVVDGRVTGTVSGGIAGEDRGGRIENVTTSRLAVDGVEAGGIVGKSTGTTLQTVKAAATATGDQYAGGLVGNASTTQIESVLVSSEVDAPTAGAIVGAIDAESAATSTYWDRTVSQHRAAGNGTLSATGLSTAELTGDAVGENTDLAVPGGWWLTDGYPVPSAVIGGGATSTLDGVTVAGNGTERNPYVLTTVEQLQAVNADLHGHYVLGNNIDARETATWDQADGREEGWQPIGPGPFAERETYDTEVFDGTFDGQNHTIRGLTIDRPDPGRMGIFGVNNGTIENVRLQDTAIATYDERNHPLHQPAGSLVGTNQGTITRITVRDGVISDREAGGLVGQHTDGTITAIEVQNVTVRAHPRGDTVGGIVALHTAGRIERVAVRNSSITGGTVGGITGEQSAGRLDSAASSGTVSGEVAGGLVGDGDSGTVDLARTTATVTGEALAGGLIGNSSGMAIKRAYAAGETTGDGVAGAIAGRAFQTDTTTVYWDRNETTRSEAAGDGRLSAVGFPTAELIGSAASHAMDGFDYADDWDTTLGYPVLQIEQDRSPSDRNATLRVELRGVDPVVSGERVGIQVLIENTGSNRVAYDPEILVSEREFDSGPYALDGGEQRRVNLSWTTTNPGRKQVVLDGRQRGELLVRAEPTLTIESLDAPMAVTVGERFAVTVTVENTGGANATGDVTGISGETDLFEQSVSLAPGEQSEITTTNTIETAGTAEFRIETPDDRANLTVTADTAGSNGATGVGTNSTAGTDSADDSGPGFGVVVAALAALLFAGRRR